METGLSSNAMPVVPGFRKVTGVRGLLVLTLVMAAPLAAQDDTAATSDPAQTEADAPPPSPPTETQPRINLLVTVPRGEVNQAQAKQCEDRADAGALSGEIVVCRELGGDGTGLTGSRAESQKRYAEETAFKGAPRAPNFIPGCKDQGNPPGCFGGFGKVPPPAYIVNFEALPKAPAGSDADRIARGLPPLNEDRELTEEEEKARREALGIKTAAPPRAKKKGG
jgi:hypothetical protein